MGCFLSCFRGSSDPSSDLQDPLVRESRLGDAFLNDEKKIEAGEKLDVEVANGGVDEELLRETPPEILEVSIPATVEDTNEDPLVQESRFGDTFLTDEKTGEKLDVEVANSGGVDEELLREANCLKSCGTISLTPPEILEVSSPASCASEHIDTSTNVQAMKEAKLLEGDLSEMSKSDEPDTLIHEQNIDQGILMVESESQTSPLSQENPTFQNIKGQKTDSSDSPYPTPLVLRGDIQTPGTVYTACIGSSKPGKRARSSRQFIYPVLRPIENKLQWMELKAESPVVASNPPKRRNLVADFSEKPQQTFAEQDEVISPEDKESKGQNVNQQLFEGGELPNQDSECGKHGAASLSYWLKPSSADDESRSTNTEDNVGKELCYEQSVFDVPIFPALGFNWDIDNPTPVLPKAWDGNGIPNTTTKYKEDQKVNWHATPFEERLMKVLSDEKPCHERKISGKFIHLEENAE